MTIFRVNNTTSLGGEVCAQWQPTHAYGLGARCVCRSTYGKVAARGYVYECTGAGTSNSTEPTWPTTPGNTVIDGGVTWTCRDATTWDNASCHLSYIATNKAVSGDYIYVHNAHNEVNALNPISGCLGGLFFVICVDKADDSLSTGAIINAKASTAISLNYNWYSYGICFRQYTSGYTFQINPSYGHFVILEGNGTDVIKMENPTYVDIGQYSTGHSAMLKIINGNIHLANGGPYILCRDINAQMYWKKGALVFDTQPNSASYVFLTGTVTCRIEDVDFSQINIGKIGKPINSGGQTDFIMTRCKYPSAGYVPFLTNSGAKMLMNPVRAHSCGASNNTYEFYEYYNEGTIEDETAIYRSGGASDGTPISHKMISSANTHEKYSPLYSPYIYSWTNSAGVSKTFTIECIVDSATNLQNDEVWMEFDYPANNADPLGGFARDICGPLAAPTDKPSSAETWQNSMSNPNKFKCQVTVTPGKSGPITARICLGKASTTIYYDPVIMES